jgi:CBS domain containing-hemolysin-like protein
MTSYRTLRLNTLPAHARVGEPDSQHANRLAMDQPARLAMTDLRRVAAVAIHPDATLEAAQQRMMHARVRMLLVTDAAGELLGLVTARDLLGEAPIRAAVDDGVARDQLAVQRVMVPSQRIQVLDWSDVEHASIGDVVQTLRDSGRQHALVVQQGRPPQVCGIFSATHIGRVLGVRIEASDKPQSFAEVEHLLAAT